MKRTVRQRKLWRWDDVVSLAASVFACVIFAVPIARGEKAFVVFAIISFVEALITFFNANIKNKMIACVFETVHAFLLSLLIVLFSLSERSDKVIYPLLISVLAAVMLIKTAIAVYHVCKYRSARNIDHHTSGNHNFISALTYAQMLCFVIASLLDVPNGHIWRIVIDLIVNFIVTNIVTTVAMFMLVRMYTDEKLTFVGKVRFIIGTLLEKDVFMYIGFFFSFMIVLFSFINALNSAEESQTGYYALSIFYFTIFITRIVSFFVWKKAIKKNYDEWELEKTKARLSLFTSIALLVEGEAIGTALVFFMQNKAQEQTPIWWFFLFLLPFALWRGVSCIMYLTRARKTNDLRIKAYGAIDLVSAGFSLCGVLAMIYRYVNYKSDLMDFMNFFVIALQVFEGVILIKLFIESIIALKSKPKESAIEETEARPS